MEARPSGPSSRRLPLNPREMNPIAAQPYTGKSSSRTRVLTTVLRSTGSRCPRTSSASQLALGLQGHRGRVGGRRSRRPDSRSARCAARTSCRCSSTATRSSTTRRASSLGSRRTTRTRRSTRATRRGAPRPSSSSTGSTASGSARRTSSRRSGRRRTPIPRASRSSARRSPRRSTSSRALLAGRDYLLGDFSVADCAAFPFLRFARYEHENDEYLFHHILIERLRPLDGLSARRGLDRAAGSAPARLAPTRRRCRPACRPRRGRRATRRRESPCGCSRARPSSRARPRPASRGCRPPGDEMPIQRVPSGLPGPGGIGFASFAQSESGGFHVGSRSMTTISNVAERRRVLRACPVATVKRRTTLRRRRRA